MALGDFDFGELGTDIGSFFGFSAGPTDATGAANRVGGRGPEDLVRQLRGIGASDADIASALGVSRDIVSGIQGETEVTNQADIANLARDLSSIGQLNQDVAPGVRDLVTTEIAQQGTQAIQAGAVLSGATPLAQTLSTRQNQTQRQSLQRG